AGMRLSRAGEALDTVIRGDDGKAIPHEIALHQLSHRGIVVYDENTRLAVARSPSSSFFSGNSRSEVSDTFGTRSRQRNREGRATPNRTLYCDVAAHHAAQALADREAEAGAAELPCRGGVRLHEVLEQAGHLFGRHPDSGIGYPQCDPMSPALRRTR